MRVTIVRSDNIVSVDGVTYEVDTSLLDASIHAVQWYHDHGEVEIKDPITHKMLENRVITNISEYQSLIDAWDIKRQEAINKKSVEVINGA